MINLVVGVLGGILGGAILRLLGALRLGGWAEDGGWLVSLAMAVAGAALLLTVLNLIRRRD